MNQNQQESGKLGFGLMRLPMIGEEVDIATSCAMTDLFLERGYTYFDTAYFYIGERSEKATREFLTSRHPRDSYTLASKMPVYAVKEEGDLEKFFTAQLERTGAGYFDYYLLHALNAGTFRDRVQKFGIWEFFQKKKKQGLIRHIGFSFHDTPETLETILSHLPDAEFVQLQINYLDWNSENVQSRACYDIARKYGKDIVIMEPVRGGALAVLPPEIRARMPEGRSPAAEALRFAASLEGVIAVLSGMSTPEQMEENTRVLAEFSTLDPGEKETLLDIAEEIRAIPTIPCTRCQYCTEVCPKTIAIPKIIGAVNGYRSYRQNRYAEAVASGVKASDCLECGLCEGNCPQKIEIRAALKEAVACFEKSE